MSRLRVWPWLRPFLVLLVVISVPPLVYWFGYVQTSVAAARQQAYSTLSAISVDFRARLEAYNTIAGTAAQANPAGLESYLNSIFKTKGSPAHVTSNVRLQLNGDSGSLLVNVGPPAGNCEVFPAPCFRQASVRLENLIPWNVVETDFDGLLVISDRNELLAQDRRLPAQAVGVAVPLRAGGALLNVEKLFDGEAPGAPADKGATGDPGSRLSMFDFGEDASLNLAGVEYIAFLQIVSVPVETLETKPEVSTVPRAASAEKETKRVRVLVCGLISKDRLRHDTIQLSPQTLIILFSLVALGLCAIPFLKLRFIGAGERMRRRDVWLLGISGLAATALLTMLVRDFHAKYFLQARFDRGVEQFAESVVRNLRSETQLAMEELRASARDLMLDPDGEKRSEPCSDKKTGTAPLPVARAAVLAHQRFEHYPDFEAIFELDLSGTQMHKWMPRTIATPCINYAAQPYFVPALTLTKESLAKGAADFVFTPIFTLATGIQLGLYAMPANRNTGQSGLIVPPEKRTGVVAIGIPMRSVLAPIVARPFEYVVLDRSGVVVYQKTQGSYRSERFIEAVHGGDALTVAARAGDGRAQRYTYRGKSYRMAAVDVPELRMTLVAFYDDAVVGSLAARVWGTAALFTLAIVGSMLLGCAIAMMMFKEPFDWAWPAPDRTGHYLVGIAACVLSMVVLVIAHALLDVFGLLLLMLLTPGFVIWLLGSGYATCWAGQFFEYSRRSVPALRWASRLATRRMGASWLMPKVFITFGVMVLASFIVWPVMVVFTDALYLRSATFQAGVANHWIAEWERWDYLNRSAIVQTGTELEGLGCGNHRDLRCSIPDRIYTIAENYNRLMSTRAELALYRDCVAVDDERTDDNGCAADALPPAPFSVTASFARLWARTGRENPEDARSLAAFEKSEDRGVRRSFLLGLGLQGAPGMLLLLCALVILVRSVARHVLGVDTARPRVLDQLGELEECAGMTCLLLRPTRKTVERLRHGGFSVDLREVRAQKVFASPDCNSTLLIEHLEARLCDEEWRKPLRELLASKHDGCVVVTSEIDPLHYLTQRAREKGEYLRSLPAGDADEKAKRAVVEKAWAELRNELAEWAITLRGIRKLREVAPEFPPPPPGDRHSAQRAKLADECTSDELIDIGTKLLARPDLEKYTWKEILAFVLDAAEPYYRSTWELCSRHEKLVLIQLAEEGFVNPHQDEVVRRLARRGLVVVKPRYRLMNESFTRFVRMAEPPERITEWERTTGKMSWSRVGTPLYALAAMVLAVLLFAEQEYFTRILAIATSGVTALGSFRSIYAAIKTTASASKPA